MESNKCNGGTWREKLDRHLRNRDSKFSTFIGALEDNTGVDRTNIVIGVCSVTALYLTFGYGKDFLCNFIGFIYPAYVSVKAIESATKEDDTKWLTYWVVYSLFVVVESFTDIFFSWIPFYFLLKCVFLLFCMAPIKCNGSVLIYNKVIRPFILKHQEKVDSGLRVAGQVGKDLLSEAENVAGKFAKED